MTSDSTAAALCSGARRAYRNVISSADSSTFLVAGGRKYGHILDPRTLEPSTSALSATILGADATLADALSNAAFILGPRAGLDLIRTFPGSRR